MKTTADVRTVASVEIQKLLDAGYTLDLIDGRTPAEYREIHAVGAVNVPLDEIEPERMMAERSDDTEPLYFICRSDSRGKQACEAFHAVGYTNVVNVAGGTVAWSDLGLPVKQGKASVSLERQVRIAAGVLVLSGVVLDLLHHPAWTALSAFIGVGLTYSGITDTCGMAMILAKMPWNRVSRAA